MGARINQGRFAVIKETRIYAEPIEAPSIVSNAVDVSRLGINVVEKVDYYPLVCNEGYSKRIMTLRAPKIWTSLRAAITAFKKMYKAREQEDAIQIAENHQLTLQYREALAQYQQAKKIQPRSVSQGVETSPAELRTKSLENFF